jgi:hypothetical protein
MLKLDKAMVWEKNDSETWQKAKRLNVTKYNSK